MTDQEAAGSRQTSTTNTRPRSAEGLRDQDRIVRLALDGLDAQPELARLQQRVALLEKSIAFQLGSAILQTLRTPLGIFGLPRTLRRMFRELRARSAIHGAADGISPASEPAPVAILERLLGRTEWSRVNSARPSCLADLRIAAVVDEFTEVSFAPDCRLLNLPLRGFEDELDEHQPHLLLVESAWRGRGSEWARKIHPLSVDILHLIGCCRRRGIPTVFWNKEDPSHFDDFIQTARWFDHVFTTDVNCLPRYRTVLDHHRVHVLSFACQPVLHNPIEHEDRRRAASFAGSWYRQYPERSRDFTRIVEIVSQVMPVEIYDRNSERRDPAFAFPSCFEPMLRAALPYNRIDVAYKGYEVGITVNTVKDSSSMFARRICELLASNTLVVTNATRGVRETFGDVVLHDDDPHFLVRLNRVHASPELLRRQRLRGLRAVLKNHTVAHRLAVVANHVLGTHLVARQPLVQVLARARCADEASALVETFQRQRWPHKAMLLMVSGEAEHSELHDAAPNVLRIPERSAGVRSPAQDWPDAWIAMFHPEDHYGEHYLEDLALATSYSSGRPVGKHRGFEWDSLRGAPSIGDGVIHREIDLALRSSLLPPGSLAEVGASCWLDRMEEGSLRMRGFATDEFNYCRGGAGKNVWDVEA